MSVGQDDLVTEIKKKTITVFNNLLPRCENYVRPMVVVENLQLQCLSIF